MADKLLDTSAVNKEELLGSERVKEVQEPALDPSTTGNPFRKTCQANSELVKGGVWVF